ncbi:MAG: hypothetical protein U0L91_01705, partial [Gemmiger sp.]|uniref:hypothetical protein n=1 Tax=Gemmiger sp. TaxID=2049027 RepID=UPI002E787848
MKKQQVLTALLTGALACLLWAVPTAAESVETLPDGTTTVEVDTAEVAEAPLYEASSELIPLATPTELSWNNDGNPDHLLNGTLNFRSVPECEGVYGYTIYRDGQKFASGEWSGLGPNEYGYSRMNTSGKINESGTYVFEVWAIGDGRTYSNSAVATSEPFVYQRPDVQTGLATDLHWDAENPAKAVYTLPADIIGYTVELYWRSSESDEWQSRSATTYHYFEISDSVVTRNSDMSQYMDRAGLYAFTVTTCSPDILKVANGDESAMSDPVDVTALMTNINNSVKEQLTAIEQGTATVDDAKKALTEQPVQTLRVGMQASEETFGLIQKTEDLYNQEKGIKVSTEISNVDLDGVSIMGAGLNAAPDQKNVTLRIDRPEKPDRVLNPMLRSVLQVSMKLDGVAQSGELDVPVVITMPVPEDSFRKALRVLHYHGDGTVEVIWPTFVTVDGVEMIRFSLTSFSDFVLAEEATQDTYTGWRTEDGKQFWYENGVKQGTTGRGKEIYDPGSDAWYWLDAIQGGAKAVDKEVYMDYEGMQG